MFFVIDVNDFKDIRGGLYKRGVIVQPCLYFRALDKLGDMCKAYRPPFCFASVLFFGAVGGAVIVGGGFCGMV